MNVERRQFFRVTFEAPADLAFGHGRHLAVRVLDLSLKGALVNLPKTTHIVVGSHCKLRVKLSQLDAHIDMTAEVAHADGSLLGLQCTGIDLDSITHLRKLIELNLGDQSLLERELQSLSSH